MKTLFLGLLLFFPLGQVARIDLGGGITVLFNDVLIFLLAAVWVFKKVRDGKSGKAYPLAIPIVLFSLAALVSLLFAIPRLLPMEFLTASFYLIRWACYACIYFVVSDFDQKFKQKLLRILLAIGFVTILLGFFQYVFYPNLRNLYYLGWDEHLFRLFSTLLDPNFFGAIAVLTFFLGLSFVASLKSSPMRTFSLVSAASSFVALLLTYSRGSFVAFVAGLFALAAVSKKKAILGIFLLLFGLGILFLPKNLQGEGVRLWRTVSILQRFASVEHAWKIFVDHPFFGVGYNAYRYAQRDYGFLALDNWQQNHAGAGADNSFVFILATTGIIGFIAYGNLLRAMVKMSLPYPFVMASLVAILTHALFVNSLFYPFIMEWLWILLGAINVGRKL